jgi:tyrosyl-tRNA synthetase
MSISDELMWKYYLLLTDRTPAEIDAMKSGSSMHPKEAKLNLASSIVTDFHGQAAAAEARDAFERRFAKGEIDLANVDEHAVDVGADGVALSKILADCGLAASSSEGARKIQQGGVKIDGEKVSDARLRIVSGAAPFLLQAGRKAVRIVPRPL